ncbi:MAG: methylmalonyl Co-A mutase-associated GTPase MeaB [Saprospiraceae bacterium]|nr:methylmalonyl Co-A mutase-associated GTPase MeaB [Saprospiraceae bacterium]
MTGHRSNVEELLARLTKGDRNALSKAITLVESRLPAQRETARSLIKQVTDPDFRTRRIAISGAPGVGKSTFIESLGLYLIDKGHKPAILTIDPSSHFSGGSILGDRTRMEELSKRDEAYIRQSPSSQYLGGVSRRTRESIFLCEAAGYDTILVETVGVGQSEYLAADLTDIFVLLVQPGSGDELQGVKKGVMEMADILVVTKADGPLEKVAQQSRRELRNAVHILQSKSHGFPREVCSVSARENRGLDNFWKLVSNFLKKITDKGYLQAERHNQKAIWLTDVVDELWLELLKNNDEIQSLIKTSSEAVKNNDIHVYDAAFEIMSRRLRNL